MTLSFADWVAVGALLWLSIGGLYGAYVAFFKGTLFYSGKAATPAKARTMGALYVLGAALGFFLLFALFVNRASS